MRSRWPGGPSTRVTDRRGAGDATGEGAGTDDDGGRRHADSVQSLDGGPAVWRAFGPEHSKRTLSDVARSSGPTRTDGRRSLR
jgi:hypothetical protein